MVLIQKTPKQLGYRFPAEWEPHAGTWLSWPKDPDTFPEAVIRQVEETYCQMISGLKSEKVFLLVNDARWEEAVREKLEVRNVPLSNVVFHRIRTADVWVRDYAPIFVQKEESIAATKWIFNSWGNKYEELFQDDAAGEAIAQAAGVSVFHPGMVLEGGSIDVNGRGLLLTTEQCLLNKNRNPQLDRKRIEEHLMDYLGVTEIIWLKRGVTGDDTDGHVDDFARFVDEKTVVCAWEENEKDANYAPLKENFSILQNAGLEVIKLPMPEKVERNGRRLPASYANFYIGNEAVLLPVFGDRKDKEAVQILEQCFPKRRIVPIRSNELVYGFGGIHCVTMQQSGEPF